MTGVIQGGTEYLWIVYVATWGSLALYFASLVIRGRNP